MSNDHIGLRLIRGLIRHAADPRTRPESARASEQRILQLIHAYSRAVLKGK